MTVWQPAAADGTSRASGSSTAGACTFWRGGQPCSNWDTSVDLSNLAAFDYGQLPEDRFVMTARREHEPLSEVFRFAENCALAGTVELVATLVFRVSRSDRSQEYAYLHASAQQAVRADRHTASRARRMCVISRCTRGALDRWSRGRPTAALGGQQTSWSPHCARAR